MVATIINGSIHIVGPGTSIITANQAANGAYTSATTTATFIVSPAPLSTAAPTPPARNLWDVISLYSNAYTTQANPVWQGAATTTDELLQGNDTKKMSNFNIEILDFDPVNLVPVSYTHLTLPTILLV